MAIARPLRWATLPIALLAAQLAANPKPVQASVAPTVQSTRADLTETTRQEALQAIRGRLAGAYIYPELVPAIQANLQDDDARYAVADPAEFARLVTQDLQEASKDTHLYLSFEPDWYAASLSPADPTGLDAENAEYSRHARAFNHGLIETRILTGNVRYLKMVGFFWIGAESAQAYDSTMRFLQDGRAIIIDLRSNRGGDTEALYYLLSHFIGAGDLITTVITPGQPDLQILSEKVLPAGRIGPRPLYILVNGRTRSAAEAVAHTVRELGLGEVVGERTEGANHISDDTAIAPYFRLSVPLSFTRDPVTQSNWEGTGVAPTIPVKSTYALDAAYSAALTRLLANTPDGQERDFILWALEGLAARREGENQPDSDLAMFVGQYGSAKIDWRDGALWLDRPEREAIRLKPLGTAGLFEAEDDDTLRVKITGRTAEILRPGSN